MRFSHLTDEELVARGGRAHDVLAQRYATAISSKARTFRIHGMPEEDVQAEMRLGFAKAIRSYNPDCGARFRTYWRRVVDNHVSDLYRHADRQGAVPISKLVDITAVDEDGFGIEDVASDEGAAVAAMESAIDASERAAAIMDLVSTVASHAIRGEPWTITAQETGIEVSAIEEVSDAIRMVALDLFGVCDYTDALSASQPTLFMADEDDRLEWDERTLEIWFRILARSSDGLSGADVAEEVGVSHRTVLATMSAIRGLFRERRLEHAA